MEMAKRGRRYILCVLSLEITLLELTSRSVKLHRFGNQKIVPLQPVGHDLLPLSILPRSITSFQCERANFVTYLSHEPTHVPLQPLSCPRGSRLPLLCTHLPKINFADFCFLKFQLEEPSFWLLTPAEVIERCINCRYNISPVPIYLVPLPSYFLTRVYHLL